jgi:hypothetical protein
MFFETSFLLLAILSTAVLTRYVTEKKFKGTLTETGRFSDLNLKRKFFVAKLMIIFLFFMVLMLWARLPIDA